MNACMCEQTFGRTNMHADRQMDGRTDSNIRPHARVHANTRMHALMNAGLYDQTGRTHTNALTHTRCTQVHTHGRTDIRTHVRTEETPKYKHGS